MPKGFSVQDKYFQKAKKLGYLARSVFKLEEIQRKFNILKKNMNVLDLGAAPGSWLQYARQIVGDRSKLVGVDIDTIKMRDKNTEVIEMDVFNEKIVEKILDKNVGKFDVILSDLAPKTSGVKEVDHFRSIELGERVVEIAERLLAAQGFLVIKVFQGSDMDDFLKKVKLIFKKVNVFKPKACRDRSFEVYIVAGGFKG